MQKGRISPLWQRGVGEIFTMGGLYGLINTNGLHEMPKRVQRDKKKSVIPNHVLNQVVSS